jgi:hypothetical protein
MYIPRAAAAAAAFTLLAIAPAAVEAQTFGIGPRLSLVQPDPAVDVASDRYMGGALRMKLSPRTAIEVAIDWRSTTSEDATVRIRDYPVQASLLVFPVRAALSPYLLGGAGWYSQNMQALDGGEVAAEQTVRRLGYHGGFGAEIRMGRRAALFADYRYTFIRFRGQASDDTGEEGAGAFGVPGFGSLLDTFKVSHEGSMWTGGVVINF